MILLTDRSDPSNRLGRDLSLVRPCKVMGLDEPPDNADGCCLLVCDVDTEAAENQDRLRTAVTRHCGPQTRGVLCLVRAMNHPRIARAHAMGATSVMDADAPRSIIVERVLQMIYPEQASGEQARQRAARAGVIRTGLALAELMEAALTGDPISSQNIERAADAALAAITNASIRHWVDVVFTHDDATYQHCLLVAGLAAAFSIALGFEVKERQTLSQAAILHDVGKARIPKDILNKPAKLTAEERTIIQTHPVIGAEILRAQSEFDDTLLEVVRHHHELLDGTGYPEGWCGARIPLRVRITTICDIYAALIEHRPYNRSLSAAQAFAIMEQMTGKLDAKLLQSFRTVVEDLS